MIRFDDVSFTYRAAGADVPALSGVSLDVEAGEMVAVLGANGSGKSTLVRLANGIALPTSGSVTVDSIATTDDGRIRELRTLVSAVFQRPDDQIVATSVEDDVAFGPENLGLPRDEIRRRVDAALDTVELGAFARREPHLLSGGQKQRLAIAGALAMSPRYLVLDEPTSMLDPSGRDEVGRAVAGLRAAGHGILLVSHDLAEVADADRVVVLEAGRVAFTGAPAELFALGDSLAAWGLELPAAALVAARLAARGVPVASTAVEPAAVVDALCR